MNQHQRCSALRKSIISLLLVTAACGDRLTAPGARRTPADNASRVISDGANGGNKDVWLLPPLLPNPSGKPGFGDAVQAGLPVVFKIVDLGASGTPVIKTLPAVFSPTDGLYQANWDTKNPVLNPDHNYRVEVWVGARNPAFADIDVVTSGGLLKTVNATEYIGLQDGRTLPLKVRVEKNWACSNKSSCVTEVVPAVIPAGDKFIVKSNDQLNAVAFEGAWNTAGVPVLVTIENITNGSDPNCGSALTIMRSSNSCIKFTADPPVVLATPAVVATCLANPGDDRQMILKYDVGETAKFLEDVAPPIVCPEGTSMVSPSASRAMRLASAAMNKVSKAFRWVTNTKPAYAIDLGVGGRLEPLDDFSYFTLGLPSVFEAVAGQGQTGANNTILPVAPAVHLVALHHHGDDPLYVDNATVTCTIVGAGGSLVVGPSLVNSAAATFNASTHTYTCPQWKLPGAAGSNTLRLSSNHHDAQFYFPNFEGGYSLHSGTLDFTATSFVVPAPALIYYGSEQYSTGPGLDFDRYTFHVTNKASIPSSLFDPIPGATSCISRTLVNFYDAATNTYIYGFCGLASSNDLDDIWIAVPRWTQPPAGVYIQLIDQLTNTVLATSNTVNLYGPLFRNYPRTLDLSWDPIPGAATYTVTVQFCSSWNPAGDWRVCTGPWNAWTTTTVTAPTTHVSNTFVGDQPGRWWVIPVDASGNSMTPTAFKFFNYITPPSP